MTLDEAYEYVDRAHEAEGEQRAEFGMGAVSLGYDGNEAMAHYDGYRTSDDSTYAEAKRIIADYQSGNTVYDQRPCIGGCGVMTEPYAPCGSEQCRAKTTDITDDIPF